MRTPSIGEPSRFRTKKPSDNYVYRPVKGSSSGQSSGWGDDLVASNLTKEFRELHMGHSSWSDDDETVEGEKETKIFHSTVDDVQESGVSIDILADELQEHILSFLPFACALRARSVCKTWDGIVLSNRSRESVSGRKPWYFMSTGSDKPLGFLYDPALHKWYSSFELPFNMKHGSNVASSLGLVCFVDVDCASHVLICNVITRSENRLPVPSFDMNYEYRALGFSVDSKSNQYTVAVVRSTRCDLTMDVYLSEASKWHRKKETLREWRGGADCVVINRILYILVRSTTAPAGDRHGLFIRDLDNEDGTGTALLPIPFTITCGRLMNVRDGLAMVGGIGKRGRPGLITGIAVWVLKGTTEWERVACVPPRMLQGLGELDDVFASSGSGDTVYIHTYGGTSMLMFDMVSGEWKWSPKFPMNKKLPPLQLFTGFCFAPRLDVSAQ